MQFLYTTLDYEITFILEIYLFVGSLICRNTFLLCPNQSAIFRNRGLANDIYNIEKRMSLSPMYIKTNRRFNAVQVLSSTTQGPKTR